ncbi:MAG: acyltransferase [Cognatishimia sp.]|uniref:acyltransferase family protein n=1 Tax=Cognatishimia sp. TaxID=2211648 RepID=UPI003B8C9348
MATTNRAYWLDSLRLIAALAVVLQHYIERSFRAEAQWFLQLGPGVFGVVLFFMISGYVIPFSVKSGFDFKEFVLRRIFRIWPMYLCVLAGIMVLGWANVAPFDAIQHLGWIDIVFNLLLIFEYSNAPAVLGVAWSLSLELIWYGFFCLYVMRFRNRHAAQIACVVSGLLVTAAGVAILLDTRLPFGRLGMLNAAMLGYAVFSYHQRHLSGRALACALLAFLLATWATQWVGFGYFTHENISLHSGVISWTIASIVFAGICLSPRIHLHNLWQEPWLIQLCAASYSIYLLHEPVSLLLVRWLNGGSLIIAALACTCGLALLCYRLIEIPAIALGRQLNFHKGSQNSRVQPID